MKIILLGYGKMGKMIEEIASEADVEVVCKINSLEDFNDFCSSIRYDFGAVDILKDSVIIDFSTASKCAEMIFELFKIGDEVGVCVKIVSGTTGWDATRVFDLVRNSEKHCFFYSANFSIGVNIFWKIVKNASEIMAKLNYNASGREIHHAMKKDAPSGTAVYTANLIRQSMPIDDFSFERIDDHCGFHEVSFASRDDQVSISHSAYSRKGFAHGAVTAAKYVIDKSGVIEIDDFIESII